MTGSDDNCTIQLALLRMRLQTATIAHALTTEARVHLVTTREFDPLWHAANRLCIDIAIAIDKVKGQIAELETAKEVTVQR